MSSTSPSHTHIAAWANRNAATETKLTAWGAQYAIPVVCTPAVDAVLVANAYAACVVARTRVAAVRTIPTVDVDIRGFFTPRAVTVVSRTVRDGDSFDALLLAASAT